MATQREALNAYVTLMRMGKKATGKAAFSLFRLKKLLQELVEFQAEEENKLVDKFGGKVAEDGLILIADDEKKAEFVKEKEELYNMELDPAVEKVKVPIGQLPEINMEEIEALEAFIDFD